MNTATQQVAEPDIIRQGVLAEFPTTIRRSVYLQHFIEINHSINPWLYKRWVNSDVLDKELSLLHQEMGQAIIEYSDDDSLEIRFVHFSPQFDQKFKGVYD